MDGAYARNTDPDTSHDAADSVNVCEWEARVLACVRMFGFNGATVDEVVDVLGDVALRWSVSPRFAPLRRKGLVSLSWQKRKGHHSNKMQQVWVATEFYDSEIEELL